jgi:hypothetical protein
MQLHANAKLGLSGRYALVCAIEGGLSLKAAAAAFSLSPATAHPLVAPLAGGRAPEGGPGRPLEPAPPLPATADGRAGGVDPARPPRDQPGPGAAGRDRPPRPLDDLEGARPARALAPATG